MKQIRRFTILELLTVTATIAILAGITLGITSYVFRKNKDAKTLATIELLKSALEQYKEKFGFYPPSVKEQTNGYMEFHLDKYDNSATPSEDSRDNRKNFNQFVPVDSLASGKFVRQGSNPVVLLDGYERPIYYRCPGYVNRGSYDLGSLGYDGKVGDGSSKAVTSSDAKDHFGKGDDISNCKR